MSDPGYVQYESIDPRMLIDHGHLRALSICHYVLAGLLMVFSSFFIIHIVMGIAIMSGTFPTAPGQTAPPIPPKWFGLMFVAMGSFAVLAGWTMGAMMIIAGRMMAKRRRRMFCLIVAAISCLFFPLGTLLGIFTILVLSRPSVIQQFDGMLIPA